MSRRAADLQREIDEALRAKKWQEQVAREDRQRRERLARQESSPTPEQLYEEYLSDYAAGVFHGERRGRQRDFRQHATRKQPTGPSKSNGRETPPDWVWAYHVAPKNALSAIKVQGLKPHWHAHVEEAPVIFVEPDHDGVMPYYEPEHTVILRFKTPGFGTTEDGESVIYGASARPNAPPDKPLVGKPGADGSIPPERLQIERNGKFKWLK